MTKVEEEDDDLVLMERSTRSVVVLKTGHAHTTCATRDTCESQLTELSLFNREPRETRKTQQ